MYVGGLPTIWGGQDADSRTHRSGKRQPREKNPRQLQELSRGFAGHAIFARATSRKKKSNALQTAELARSNISGPTLIDIEAEFGTPTAGDSRVEKSYEDLEGDFRAFRQAWCVAKKSP